MNKSQLGSGRRVDRLGRRVFLRGVGVSMALPWLESLLPVASRSARAASQSGTPPVRLAFVFFPNGAIMDSWKPKQDGTGFEYPATLEPLAAHRDDLLILSGLAQDNGRAKGDGPGDHARSAASFLTGAHPVKTSGADIRVGVSADQLAAELIGGQTRLPSLELGIERGKHAGSCDSGYSCAYSNTISWKNGTTPVAKEIQPRLVFDRLFGTQPGNDRSEAARAFYRRSILDLVAGDAARLQRTVGQTDRRKLDEYFTGIRELETRIERTEREAAVAASEKQREVAAPPPNMDIAYGIPSDVTQHIRLMYDLLALAFQTDTTRVATLMLANEGSNRSYAMVDVKEGHHQLSHHQGNQEKIEKIRRIDHFLATQFAYFLEKLKSIREGEGTLLDNSLIVYGSGLSDGNAHNHHDLPIAMAGRGGGTVTPGRHIVYPRDTPLNNLFLSMLDRAGARCERLGDSTGLLPQLDV